jgi:YD repeat-containing protein
MPKVTETLTWNDRLQLTGIAVAKGTSALLTLGNYPCADGTGACTTGNTGSILSQSMAIAGLSNTATHTYDALSRLKTSDEKTGPSSNWSQTYDYDVKGNRWVSASNGYTLNTFTPTVASNFGANNRLAIQSSAYDDAGNQKAIGVDGFTSSFDAEGRMTANTLNNSTARYIYDGAGRRVRKETYQATTTFVYDAMGNLAAEYTAPVTGQQLPSGMTDPCGMPTCYVTVDQVGRSKEWRSGQTVLHEASFFLL